MAVTAVIADDHTFMRKALADSLANMRDIHVVATAKNGLEAIAEVRRHTPDLLILDAAMPMANGVEVFADVRRWCPDTKVVTCTGFTSHTLLAEWIDLEVDGLLLKTSDGVEFARCIETVLAGYRFVAEDVREILKTASEKPSLTHREREVLSLIALGNTSQAIADRLHISIKTVEKHRGSLMAKLGVRSVAELLAYALKEGFLDTHQQL
ncbi:MAG: response regulator transcription factor [Pseudomonadota bacterium]